MSTKHIITLRTTDLAPDIEETEAGYAIAIKFLLDSINNADISYVGIEKAHHDHFMDSQCESEEPMEADETVYEIRLDLDQIVHEGEVLKPDADNPDSLMHYVTLVMECREAMIQSYDCEVDFHTRKRIFIDLQCAIDTSSLDDPDEIIDKLS